MPYRESITKFILKKLAEIGETSLENIFPRNRAESLVWRQMLGLPAGYEFSKPTFLTLLHRLKKEGLVDKSGKGKNSKWLVTILGQRKVKYYQNSIMIIAKDNIPRLVIYDIPESQRKKRDWIRYELAAAGYEQLQKSVWLGYSPLPEEFVKSIKDFGVEDKVHIVSVNKKGTLHKL
ncbi:MAG: hypothetical protein HY452_01225 [Parcubacteria group bacterium]|nr:hypothetical protein [Parcubacteria group bacterium]